MLRISRRRGFTLIELAIVLGIVGVLGVGLWRLFSGSSAQMGDQSAATQQTQLIGAIKGYLASAEGQGWMGTNNGNANANNLALPTSNNNLADCQAHIAAANKGLCDFLPAGFMSGTVNSYSQAFLINVAGDGKGAGTPPVVYSFMILTIGGSTIADISGGRLAALIGNDGGFIYTAAVCTGAPSKTTACGAYSAWSASTTGASPGYGFAIGNSQFGHIASRTFVNPEQSSSFPWLARQFMSGDLVNKPTYNTMTTPAFLGGQTLYAGIDSTLKTGGKTTNDGAIDAQGGTINMQKGIVDLNGGTLVSTIGGNPDTNNGGISLSVISQTANPPIIASTACTIVGFNGAGQAIDGSGNLCNYAMSTSSINVSAIINANSYYASGSFLYGSDIRLKTNIHALNDPLEDLMRLKPVAFTYKSNGKESMGVIAQDLEKVYPQLVASGPGNSIKYVDYMGLVAPLVGAVQELQKENDELRHQIKDQEIRENKLEEELRQHFAK